MGGDWADYQNEKSITSSGVHDLSVTSAFSIGHACQWGGGDCRDERIRIASTFEDAMGIIPEHRDVF